MAKSLIILPEAEQDITEAYNWYQERELGLGEEFLRCIDASIQTIKRNPEILALNHWIFFRIRPRTTREISSKSSIDSGSKLTK
jgi:hypothetical protein